MNFPTDAQADAALAAVELEDTVVKFVRGLRGSRQDPVNFKQVRKYIAKVPMFEAVTERLLDNAVNAMIEANRIRIVRMSLSSTRRYNGAYGYLAD